jgi:hypothetical protein
MRSRLKKGGKKDGRLEGSRRRSSVRSGKDGEEWSLYYRAAAKRRARCTYTTPSKRMTMEEVLVPLS